VLERFERDRYVDRGRFRRDAAGVTARESKVSGGIGSARVVNDVLGAVDPENRLGDLGEQRAAISLPAGDIQDVFSPA
jgi:hypothetical protein